MPLLSALEGAHRAEKAASVTCWPAQGALTYGALAMGPSVPGYTLAGRATMLSSAWNGSADG